MNDRINTHLKLCIGVKNIPSGWEMLKQFSENQEQLLDFVDEVKKLDLKEKMAGLGPQAVEWFVRDVGFCQMYQWLLDEGIEKKRISSFLSEFPKDERISGCDYKTLVEVLKDKSLNGIQIYNYWAYFMKYSLEAGKRERLLRGMDFFFTCSDLPLKELPEQQRKLFWEPALSDGMLRGDVDILMVLQKLEDEKLLKLINQLSFYLYGGGDLSQEQFLQLASDAQKISVFLKPLMEIVPQELHSKFLMQWLYNENLLYDLKKLSFCIPKMKEDEIENLAYNRVAYVGILYGEVMYEFVKYGLSKAKEDLLLYAITHKKRHFLALIKENIELFQNMSAYSILCDPDFYRQYVNINTLNEKNLLDCEAADLRIVPAAKPFMTRSSYTFEEIKSLAGLDKIYVKLYHLLEYERVDERLTVFREIVKKKCLSLWMQEDTLKQIGKALSIQRLSFWMQKNFGQIKGLTVETAMRLLIYKSELSHFIPALTRDHQVRCLLDNLGILPEYATLAEFEQHIISREDTWLSLKEKLHLSDEFVAENRERITAFLYEGGAQIIMDFCRDNEACLEPVRRILVAEFMGQLKNVKYHEDDLSKEIDYQVDEVQKTLWTENDSLERKNGVHIWEEDAFLPVIQIGKIPTDTCLSYVDGAYKNCLLSGFDANKKVMFASMNGKVVFRAFLRLTKGGFGDLREKVTEDEEKQEIEFVDLLQEQKKQPECEKPKELLTLFLERPYHKWLSEDEISQVMMEVFELAERKAEKLGAKLLIASDYGNYLSQWKEKYIYCKYSVYISKSKNGKQYLDSLGGKASVVDSGSYRVSAFYMKETECRQEPVQ